MNQATIRIAQFRYRFPDPLRGSLLGTKRGGVAGGIGDSQGKHGQELLSLALYLLRRGINGKLQDPEGIGQMAI